MSKAATRRRPKITHSELDSVELKLAALFGDAPLVSLPPRSMVGEVVAGTYEITGTLGEGGMGRVFTARHIRTGGEVAVKLIHPRHAQKIDFVERFEKEARNTAALNHPNVVKVFDYGLHNDLSFIAMELVAGRSVRDMLREQRVLPEPTAIAIAAHVLRALQASHDCGLVHGDIKPDNILAESDGESWFVKVVDFGIAHAFAASRGPRTVTGTPHSMAPEQFHADAEVTPKSDLYALGCTMYAMLSGNPPFDGTFWELAVLHAEQPPAPLEHVHKPLADWVLWLLAKSPDDRPESARVALKVLTEAQLGDAPSRVAAPHLPSPRHSFVGRSKGLAALAPLRSNGPGLVTLTGMGGIGKTRLALEWARSNAESFAGNAYFCDLSETKTEVGICIAVARTLGTSLGDDGVVAATGRALASLGPTLLILDNFEQLVEHAGGTIGAWRAAAPQVTFLVTSRHRLELAEEHVVSVEPLATDGPNAAAVQLFLDRARQARPEFVLDDEDSARVREIVARVDGLPLAIEMAAARMKTLTPQAILERLDERFRLLRSSHPDLSERQMTMRATLDWSWELLSDVEQAMLRQLGAFARSFDLEAAEATVDLQPFGDPWVVDILEALIDKSLIRRVENDRFALFVSVHDFAVEKLAKSADEERARGAHLRHYASLGTDEAIGRREADRATFDAHGREIENLQRAIDFGLDAGPNDDVALCTTALTEYFHLRGPLETSISLGERVLERLPESMQTGRLSSSVGLSYVRQGDYTAARGYAERGLELCRNSGDENAIARATIQLGFVHLHFGRIEEAIPLLDEGATLIEKTPLERWKAVARLFQGLALLAKGQPRSAFPICVEALELAVVSRNKRAEGWVRRILTKACQQQGQVDQAFVHAQRSLDLARDLRETGSEAWALNGLGEALAHAGRFPAAIAHYGASRRVAKECGETFLIAETSCRLAEAAVWLGHPHASEWVEEAVATNGALSAHSRVRLAESLIHHDPSVATRLLDELNDELAAAPDQLRADALLQRAALAGASRPAPTLVDELNDTIRIAASAGATAIHARCLLEQVLLHLALGQLNEAADAMLAVQNVMPSAEMPAALKLREVCLRTHVLHAHGLRDEARDLCLKAIEMREDFGLYPHAHLAKLVEQVSELTGHSEPH